MQRAEHEVRIPMRCLREPIAEIFEAARELDKAVMAHLAGDRLRAAEIILATNTPTLRKYVELMWGARSPYVRVIQVPDAPPLIPAALQPKPRMPSPAEKRALLARDGYHCRFCGIPVIRPEVRRKIKAAYPDALSWGRKNATQHAAFQVMWLQYDHLLPFARGGPNDIENMVIACAPCNFSRMNWLLEEVGLLNPREREPIRSSWDGLERFR